MSSIVIPKFTLWNFQPFYIWTTPDNGGYVISEYRIESANGQAGYGVFQVCLSSSGPTRTFYVIPYGIYNLSIPLSGNQCSSLYTFYIPIGGLAQDLSISTSLPLEEGTYTLTFNIGYMQNNTFVVTDSRTVVIYIIPPLGCPPGTYCMMTFTCEMLGGKCLKYGCGCIGNIPTTICPGGTCCDYNLPGVNCCCAFPQMVPTTTTTTTLTTTTTTVISPTTTVTTSPTTTTTVTYTPTTTTTWTTTTTPTTTYTTTISLPTTTTTTTTTSPTSPTTITTTTSSPTIPIPTTSPTTSPTVSPTTPTYPPTVSPTVPTVSPTISTYTPSPTTPPTLSVAPTPTPITPAPPSKTLLYIAIGGAVAVTLAGLGYYLYRRSKH